MQKINTISTIKNWVEFEKSCGKTIALVPTMGGLHAGHLALVYLAKKRADKVVVSIFVNPTQFSKDEDFGDYPRSIVTDLEVLKSKNVDAVFIPDVAEIYPENQAPNHTNFGEKQYLFDILCGQTRPHFFYGVLQVVRRLFDIVRPDIAVFGQKDYQQLSIIKQFTSGVEILSGAIVREDNGLAMSTRNQYLSVDERNVSGQLHKILSQLQQGEFDLKCAKEKLQQYFKLDYLEVLDADTLEKINDNTSKIAILCAVFLGSMRLIDNIIFTKG